MTNNYVYEFGDSLYLNITNRCPNNCEFCIRNIKDGVSGNDLWLLKEPTFQELAEDIALYDLSKYKEIVFCGFGEPMCNLSMISQIAPYLKKKGCKIRINTNGLGNLINNRDDVAKLIAILQRLVSSGNTVVVIEHNLDVIKVADNIVDLGPDGGDRGGTIVDVGTPEHIAENEKSYTGQFLKRILK